MGLHQIAAERAQAAVRKGPVGQSRRGDATSALAGGMITHGEAATIAAALAMPDLDLIKQGEQEVWVAGSILAWRRKGGIAEEDVERP
jgi:hypothetical protein